MVRKRSQIIPEVTPDVVSASHQTHASHAHKFILGYLFILIFAALAGVLYTWQHDKVKVLNDQVGSLKSQNASLSTEVSTLTPKNHATTSSSPSYDIFTKPKPLGDLNFFSNVTSMFGTNCSNGQTTNCPPTIPADQINYAEIGTTPSKQPIVVAYDYNALEESFYYVAIETSSNQYEILSQLSDNSDLNAQIPSDQQSISFLKNNLSSNVSLDTTDTIAALSFPQTAVVHNQGFSLPGGNYRPGYFIPSLSAIAGPSHESTTTSQMTKLGTVGDISYYEVTLESQPSYSAEEMFAVIGGVFAAPYQPVDPLLQTSDGDSPNIEFIDGSYNAKDYTSSTFGCGALDAYVVATGLNPSQLTYVGSGPNGEPLYELPTTSPLFTAFYNNSYSIARFQADHALIVAENALGQYVLYERSDMFEFGGCGKPVIYLYPQKTTEVSVGVGAHVTASDPSYTADGWQNVLAQPNGDLTYEGKSYPYLYWEGTGDGSYPLITSGTVVPAAKVVATIMQQLAEQGLNHQEAQAFMEYWRPKLPRAPYIRLSWLNTSQMNELAPLFISPKPQTLIRVFLDFQGLNQPISIAPQTFNAPPRKGFTVVEWGGLLRQ